MTHARTDREHLIRKEYATDAALSVRIRTHELYTQPPVDFAAWVLDHLAWRGDETVLDVGCGSGAYLAPVHERLTRGGGILAADLSLGMLRDLRAKRALERVSLLNASVTALPLPDACCDVAMANHMLFYVQDLPRALAEIRRVLRPGGQFVATTNARDSMQVLWDEVIAACNALGFEVNFGEGASVSGFNLENGDDIIAPFFPDVTCYTLETALVFPEPEPVLDYVNSTRTVREPLLPPGLTWDAMMEQLQRQVSARIYAKGEYRVPKTSGMFLGARPLRNLVEVSRG